jgi:hypothetical protein
VRLCEQLDAARAQLPEDFAALRRGEMHSLLSELGIQLPDLGGVHSDGGATVADVTAALERFEQLADDAEEASR